MSAIAIERIFAMGCITVLTAIALLHGINTSLFHLAMIALAGLGGFAIGRKK